MKKRRVKRRIIKMPSKIEMHKSRLRNISDALENWFDEATAPRIKELQQKSTDLIQKIDALDNDLTHEKVDRDGRAATCEDETVRPCDADLEMYDDMGELYFENEMVKEQLLSVETMRIVSLYRDFEVLLKDLLKEAFPGVNKRELFLWENVKDFVNSKGVPFAQIKDYQSINWLRIVNNNIKHSGVIDEELKKQDIPEFKGLEMFDSDSVATFYARIREIPGTFLNILADELIKYLYEFDDARISSIANGIMDDYKDRMDDKTTQKLLAELKEIHV